MVTGGGIRGLDNLRLLQSEAGQGGRSGCCLQMRCTGSDCNFRCRELSLSRSFDHELTALTVVILQACRA